jgi:60 kDa SS-A/Ro ribonucleoprotein
MRSNLSARSAMYEGTNHEGVLTRKITPEQQLRRSVMSAMLFEGEFYEDGETIASRVAKLIPEVDAGAVRQIALDARNKMHLRHMPLFIVREMARVRLDKGIHRKLVADTLVDVIQRADELAEFLALYWKDGKQPLSAQVKKGLRNAFTKFDAYALAKYNRDNVVKLRDVLFLSHAKPVDDAQAEVFKKLVNKTLEVPDTWEVALSASKGENKREVWERLLRENKLGAMALIRNLRNFIEEGVDTSLVKTALALCKPERVLPFRFLAAVRHAPQFALDLEALMLRNLEGQEKLPGNTVLLVDVSPSMNVVLSDKSEMTRMDAGCGLAVLLREVCESVRCFAFSTEMGEAPAYRGLALADAVKRAAPSNGTLLGRAVTNANNIGYDRLIVVTDEESQDPVPMPKGDKAYMVNVASNKNGIGYHPWVHIDGWSNAIVDYIREYERVPE